MVNKKDKGLIIMFLVFFVWSLLPLLKNSESEFVKRITGFIFLFIIFFIYKFFRKYNNIFSQKMPSSFSAILDKNKNDNNEEKPTENEIKAEPIKTAKLKLNDKKIEKNNLKILHFENDPFFSEIYKKNFEEVGFTVKSSLHPERNVFEDIEKFKPDLIITNINMPERDGYQLIEKIKKNEQFQKIPIFVLSNLGGEDFIKRIFKLGVSGYLTMAEHTPLEIALKVKDFFNSNEKKILTEIDISKIETDFGENDKLKDYKLLELLSSCYEKKLTCRKALIKIEFIQPFTNYKPPFNEKVEKYYIKKFQSKDYPELSVYQEGEKFIMSDDYNAYYFYKKMNHKNIPCLVIGEIKGEKGIVEISNKPFYLKEPTVEVI